MKAMTIVAALGAAAVVSTGPASAGWVTPGAHDGEPSPDETREAVMVIDDHASDRGLSPVLQGVNHTWFQNANGLWDAATGAPNADAAAKISKAGIGLLRFPGGSRANLYDWKRSIGPDVSRLCQTDGVTLQPRADTGYGSDEFMRLAHAVGAEPEIAVPFANASPEDTADWFEYLNAPVGTNPNGGTAWADVRAANGSPEPYDVTRWEIGNEPYLAQQSFWMDPIDTEHRLAQFIAGDEISFVDQPLGRNCDFNPPAQTTRNPGQTFYLMYRLIKPGTSFALKVGDVPWTEVPDLASAGSVDRVYALDRSAGTVTFGDGVHGAIPSRAQTVTATYTFDHQGFVAIYDALKSTASQIGLNVDVCAAWAPIAPRGTPWESLGAPSFAQEMARRGLAASYDCVATHPYTSLGSDFWPWNSAEDAHHAHMVGDDFANTLVSALDADLAVNSENDAFVAITEMGALWFGAGPEKDQSVAHMPEFGATMTHALYMASQWLRYADSDVGWVVANDLAPDSLRGTLGGSETGFVYGAEALTREAMKPFFASGSVLVGSEVEDQDLLTAPDGTTWPTLVVGASLAVDGSMHIVVVNRNPSAPETLRIVPAGFQHSRNIDVTTVEGASFTSFNDDGTRGGDNTVALTHSQLRTRGEGAFEYVFPAASVTVLTLQPR
jgi:alpha-N-arabinofuranosidase